MRRLDEWSCLIASLLLVSLVACGTGSSSPAATPAAGGTVAVAVAADWGATLDPQTANPGSVLNQVLRGFYDRLVATGPNGKIVPYLAKSWKASATSITFNLRNDAKCADGTSLTPTRIAASFKRLVDPATRFPRREGDFGKGPFTITADDSAATMTFASATPYGPMLAGFADGGYAQTSVVCPAGLANPSMLVSGSSGSGPYTIESATHGDQMVLKARPEWNWGPQGSSTKSPGFPDKLIFKVVINPTTAANLLVTGGLNLVKLTGSDAQRLDANKVITHASISNYMSHPIVMNLAAGHPTADEAVRQAIMLSVSPKDYLQAAYSGRGKPGTSLFADTADCYDPNTAQYYPKQDVAKAKSVLQAAGYQPDSSGAMTKGGQKLNLTLIGMSTQGAGPELLQTELTNAGFTVKTSILDLVAYQAAYTKGNYDLFVVNINAPSPDISPLMVLFSGPLFSEGGSSWEGARIPALDAEVAAATQTTGAESCKHWAKVQEMFLTQYIIMPLVTPSNDWYSVGVSFQPGVVNIEPWTIRRK